METYSAMKVMSCKFELVESFGIVQMLLADNSADIYQGRSFNFDIDFGVSTETSGANSTLISGINVPFSITVPDELFATNRTATTTDASNYTDDFNFEA